MSDGVRATYTCADCSSILVCEDGPEAATPGLRPLPSVKGSE